MTKFEIKEKTTFILDRLIELQAEAVKQFTFIPEIDELYKELHELREKCTHEYINGICQICRKEQ